MLLKVQQAASKLSKHLLNKEEPGMMALSALTSETELTLPAKYVFKNDLELSVQKAGEEF